MKISSSISISVGFSSVFRFSFSDRARTGTRVKIGLVTVVNKRQKKADENVSHTGQIMWHAARGTRHAARGTRHAARGTRHAARGTRHAARGQWKCITSTNLRYVIVGILTNVAFFRPAVFFNRRIINMSGRENGKKYLKPFKDGRNEKRRSAESPVDWEMYLVAVIRQEPPNHQPVTHGPPSSVDSQTACKQQESYSIENNTTALQQLFTKRNAVPGNFYGTMQVNVIGDQEREITSIDYLLGVGAKCTVEQIETQKMAQKEERGNL